MDTLFITCPEGLEPLLKEELEELGFSNAETGFRGVYVEGSMKEIYKINYLSRLAGRVLLPLAHFNCFGSDDLYNEAKKLDWLKLIPKGKSFAIDCNGEHRFLRHTLYASQVVKDAICDVYRKSTGGRPNVNPRAPDVQLNLFLQGNKATLSYDTSGMPLYKRGYRQENVEAPIQEALAAAILRIAKYKGEDVLLDPCCGSATFLIEAAYLATKTPSGYLRKKWGFLCHPDFSSEEWEEVKKNADAKRVPMPLGKIWGVDIHKDSVRIARSHLRAAGFHKEIEIQQSDFRDYTPKALPTLVISNPPHGQRLGEVKSLVNLYRSLGDFLKHQMVKPGRGFVFTSSLELSKEVGLKPIKRHVISNSGLDSRLLEFDLY